MTRPNDEQLPEGLDELADELRTRRTQSTPLELDRIKHRAMAQASRGVAARQREGLPIRSRILTLALLLGLAFGGGTAGVIAAGGGGGSGGSSAASSQYTPPKHCNKRDPGYPNCHP